MPKFQLLYKMERSDFIFRISIQPQWYPRDSECWYILTPPLTSDDGYMIYNNLNKNKFRIAELYRKIPFENLKIWLVGKQLRLKYKGFPIRLDKVPFQDWKLSTEMRDDLLQSIQDILAGRILSEVLLISHLRSQGWWPADITRALDAGLYSGLFTFLPGAIYQSWGTVKCSRCNSIITEVQPCPECRRLNCPICFECEALGSIRGCYRLWYITNHIEAYFKRDTVIKLSFPLTVAQKSASTDLLEFLTSDKDEIMVWAACGAGKTEVSFAAIKFILNQGKEVLFAIPRRDVVQELGERLRVSFPDTEIAEHYGGKPWSSKGQLVVATTHQVLRFYHRFDLVILDEIDAFPYHGSEMLQFGLRRSIRPGGKLITMTATPFKIPSIANRVMIPARYHGYPVPEPQVMKLKLPHWNEVCKIGLPQVIIDIVKNHNAPWLIFVPTIAATQAIARTIEKATKLNICWCHAGDPQRDQKRIGLAEGNYQVMVTTSIMERGITISDVQVMVLYSDHFVYQVNSLVQMAGRVGRKADHPTGEVWFVAKAITPVIKEAQKRINYLNHQARKLGMLKEGW